MAVASDLSPATQEYLQALYNDQQRGITPEGRAAINAGEFTEADLHAFYQGVAAEQYEGWQADFATRYPDLAWMLGEPELGAFIQEVTEDPNMSQSEALQRFEATRWYQDRSTDQRNWDILFKSDPVTARRSIERQALLIRNMAMSQGIELGPAMAEELAYDSLAYGMTDEEVKAKLMVWVDQGRVTSVPGAFGDSAAAIKAMAASYYITLSDGQAENLAKNVFVGKASLDVIRNDFAEKAKAAYPWLTEAIDGGLTGQQYYEPIIGEVASLLELSPSEVNLMDPEWKQLLTVSDDGKLRAPTITEAGQWARGQQRWLATENGARSTSQVGRQVMETFGAIKT